MSKHVKLRELTDEEARVVRRLASSRTTAVRAVQRAKIIAALLDEPTLKASETALQTGYRSAPADPRWVKRFNAEELAGLDDRARPGVPPTHSEGVRSKLIDLALQKPRSLGDPFAPWTLDGYGTLSSNVRGSASRIPPSGHGWRVVLVHGVEALPHIP